MVEATPKGLKMVERLSRTVEGHYQWLEKSLGKQKLAQLYGLLDELDRTGAAMSMIRRAPCTAR